MLKDKGVLSDRMCLAWTLQINTASMLKDKGVLSDDTK